MPLIIRLALQSDADDILDFLRTDYYPDEPLRQSLDPRQPPCEEDEDFLLANIQDGTCLIAEDNNCRIQDNLYSNQIVGVLIAGQKYNTETDHLIELSNIVPNEKWSKILKLYAYLDSVTNVYQRYNVTKAVHVHGIAVARRNRGQLISNKMMQKFMEIAYKMGYQLMTMDCTSIYAIRICENLNMECVLTLAYANYRDENGKQVFFPPEPHKNIKTFMQRL